jgi:hypothetical protein
MVIIDESVANEFLNRMLDRASRVAIVTTYISKSIVFIS